MKNNRVIYWLLYAVLLMPLLLNCKKETTLLFIPPDPVSIPVLFNPNLTYGTMTDQDGNTYKTIKIGTQTWMAENLQTTKYRNGDPIPNVTDNDAWINLTTGAYCNYDNDAAIGKVYGHLYNWYAATDSRNIAPTGWHVPTDEEWTILTDYLGGEFAAGYKLTENGTGYWATPVSGTTNESGFTALPAGWRSYIGTYFTIGYSGAWWSVTEYSTSHARGRSMYSGLNISRSFYGDGKFLGFSVRCLKD